MPGPAQPGIPLVAPPVIPQPAVPPTVVPETEPLAPPPGAENIRFKLDNVKLQGVTVYTPDQLKPLYAGLIGKEVPLTEIFKVATLSRPSTGRTGTSSRGLWCRRRRSRTAQ